MSVGDDIRADAAVKRLQRLVADSYAEDQAAATMRWASIVAETIDPDERLPNRLLGVLSIVGRALMAAEGPEAAARVMVAVRLLREAGLVDAVMAVGEEFDV